MSIEDVFPSQELSKTEADIVASSLAHPSVKKYLRSLAANDTKELLALSAISNDDRKLAMAHATVQGKLQVVATLLSIEDPNPTSTKE